MWEGSTRGVRAELRRRPCTQLSAPTPETESSPIRSPSTTEDIRQVIGGINGFKAYYLLKIAEGTTTISVFEDQAGAEESNRAAAAWLAENLPDLEIAAPYVTAGEVLVGF